jgi:hypothetical protein
MPKEIEVDYGPDIVCEVCSHLYNRDNEDRCLESIPLPTDSETTHGGSKAPDIKCGRFKSHDGPHVACVMQPVGDKGGKVRGLWRRFHVTWED